MVKNPLEDVSNKVDLKCYIGFYFLSFLVLSLWVSLLAMISLLEGEVFLFLGKPSFELNLGFMLLLHFVWTWENFWLTSFDLALFTKLVLVLWAPETAICDNDWLIVSRFLLLG